MLLVYCEKFNMFFIANVIALLFALKLFKKSLTFTPKFESHYGIKAKKILRQLETFMKKIVKHQEDVEFLQVCITYQLSPKFVRFKMHKKEREKLKLIKSLKQNLLLTEISFHKCNIIKLENKAKQLRYVLFKEIGLFSKALVMKFLDKQIILYQKSVKGIHERKLKDLGMHLLDTSTFNIIRNLCNRKLTDTELKVLNRGLKFGIFPKKINWLNVQTEFKSLYQNQHVRFKLNNKDRIDTKLKLISLYKKYKSSFIHY